MLDRCQSADVKPLTEGKQSPTKSPDLEGMSRTAHACSVLIAVTRSATTVSFIKYLHNKLQSIERSHLSDIIVFFVILAAGTADFTGDRILFTVETGMIYRHENNCPFQSDYIFVQHCSSMISSITCLEYNFLLK